MESIAEKLISLFGKDVNIYTDNVEQGFKEPCFYIYEGETETADELMGYQKLTRHFYLVFFPNEKSEAEFRDQCAPIQYKFLTEFDAIEIGRFTSGCLNRKAKYNDVERVAQLQFDLKYRLAVDESGISMDVLEQGGGIISDSKKER